jgi:hypothetical protein
MKSVISRNRHFLFFFVLFVRGSSLDRTILGKMKNLFFAIFCCVYVQGNIYYPLPCARYPPSFSFPLLFHLPPPLSLSSSFMFFHLFILFHLLLSSFMFPFFMFHLLSYRLIFFHLIIYIVSLASYQVYTTYQDVACTTPFQYYSVMALDTCIPTRNTLFCYFYYFIILLFYFYYFIMLLFSYVIIIIVIIIIVFIL